MIDTIEQGNLRDLDRLEELYNDCNDALACTVNYPGWKKDVYPIREDAQIGIDEKSLYLAKENNVIVGSIILNHKEEPGYENVPWLCHADKNQILVIHTLVVHPNYGKRGIGKQLMEFAETYARSCKMKAIRLDVFVKNIPAISLYERCGYQYITDIDEGLGKYGLDLFRVYEKSLN